jgi:hypothetical protein
MKEGSKIIALHSSHGYRLNSELSESEAGSTTNAPRRVFGELFQTHYIWEYCGIRLWNQDWNPHYISQRKNGLRILPDFGAAQNLSSVPRGIMSGARRPPERRDWAYLRREARYLVENVLLGRMEFATSAGVRSAHNNLVATKEIIDVFDFLGYI